MSNPFSEQQIFEAPAEISFARIRIRVLDWFLRNYSIIRNNTILMGLSREELNDIAYDIKIPYILVDMFINQFIAHMLYFKEFIDKKLIRYGTKDTFKKSRLYLHKVHRLAPVFNYKKARVNLKILKSLMSRINFWPTLTTQLAIVIYITDKLDNHKSTILIQKNIRTICNCSAYAFHMAKNKLHIDDIIDRQLTKKNFKKK